MFVDASAIVAILADEPERVRLARALDAASNCITSPIAIWESAAAVSRAMGSAAHDELPKILELLELAHVSSVPVDVAVCRVALDAFDKYGRRSGHPAQLNMGDCFAYAYATSRGIPLLFIGNDFPQTDVMRAIT